MHINLIIVEVPTDGEFCTLKTNLSC